MRPKMPQDNQFASVARTDKACNLSALQTAEKLKKAQAVVRFSLNAQAEFGWYSSCNVCVKVQLLHDRNFVQLV